MDQFIINFIALAYSANVTFTIGGTDYTKDISISPSMNQDDLSALLAQQLVEMQALLDLGSFKGMTFTQTKDGSISVVAQTISTDNP